LISYEHFISQILFVYHLTHPKEVLIKSKLRGRRKNVCQSFSTLYPTTLKAFFNFLNLKFEYLHKLATKIEIRLKYTYHSEAPKEQFFVEKKQRLEIS